MEEVSYWIGDAHTDAVLYLDKNQADLVTWGKSQWDLAKCSQAGVKFQVMALYIESEYKPERALQQGLHLLELTRQFAERQKEQIFLIESRQDLSLIPEEKRLGLMLSVEGGEILAGKVWMVDVLYRLGIRAIGLTWNQRNDLADGAGEAEANGGLTRLGKEVVKRMNERGMAVDLSHLSEQSFWDVLKVADQPPYASHSCVASLCSHPRNLSDKQIIELARSGGIVGINFYSGFLRAEGEAKRADVVKHIQYIADLVGPDYVALGSDFDGVEEQLPGLEDVTMFPALLDDLERAGFSRKEIQGIGGENLLNYFKKVIK